MSTVDLDLSFTPATELARRIRARDVSPVEVVKASLARIEEGLNVDAVSARVGYSDLSTFRRLFRRETGLSPREYQRRFSRSSRQRQGMTPQAARQRLSDLPR